METVAKVFGVDGSTTTVRFIYDEGERFIGHYEVSGPLATEIEEDLQFPSGGYFAILGSSGPRPDHVGFVYSKVNSYVTFKKKMGVVSGWEKFSPPIPSGEPGVPGRIY